MNLLKLKTMIHCNTCGRAFKRNKTIKVRAFSQKEAVLEVREKIHTWKESLKGKNCKLCQSIIEDSTAKYMNNQKTCYQCEKDVDYLFEDGRCWRCTRIEPDSVRG